MRSLGIHLSPDERLAVANGLVVADKKADNLLARYVRESGEIERSLGLIKDATNEQLLERLTLRQIELALDGPSTDLHVVTSNPGLEGTPQSRYSTAGLSMASDPSLRARGALHQGAGRARHLHEPVNPSHASDESRNLIVGGTPVITQEFPFSFNLRRLP